MPTVAENVGGNRNSGRAGFDVSANGLLVYRDRSGRNGLAWKDRTGKTVGSVPSPLASALKLSPDDKRVVVVMDPPVDLWIYEMDRDQPMRLTNDAYVDTHPVWSPDGTRLIYQSYRTPEGREGAVYEKAANGATPERLLFQAEPGMSVAPSDWSRDGQWIVLTKEKARSPADLTPGVRDLWLLPGSGDSKPAPYLVSKWDKLEPTISPNGRWLAYTSNEGGSYGVYVQTFPDPSGGKWPVSKKGGRFPRWRHDGGELYYQDPANHIVAVPVGPGATFSPRPSTTLDVAVQEASAFDFVFRYDVATDGQRFLLRSAAAPATEGGGNGAPLNVMLNWTSALKK